MFTANMKISQILNFLYFLPAALIKHLQKKE